MSLGKYVKQLRFKSKVEKVPTVKEVAEAAGIPESTLDFIERERTSRPNDETLEKIARYYGVSMKSLVEAMYEL